MAGITANAVTSYADRVTDMLSKALTVSKETCERTKQALPLQEQTASELSVNKTKQCELSNVPVTGTLSGTGHSKGKHYVPSKPEKMIMKAQTHGMKR